MGCIEEFAFPIFAFKITNFCDSDGCRHVSEDLIYIINERNVNIKYYDMQFKNMPCVLFS